MAHPYSFETYYTNKVQVIKPFLTTVGALIKKLLKLVQVFSVND